MTYFNTAGMIPAAPFVGEVTIRPPLAFTEVELNMTVKEMKKTDLHSLRLRNSLENLLLGYLFRERRPLRF